MVSFDFELLFFTQAFMKNKVLSLCFSQNRWPPQLLGSAEGAIPGICRRSAPGFKAAVLSTQLHCQMIGYLILQLKKKKDYIAFDKMDLQHSWLDVPNGPDWLGGVHSIYVGAVPPRSG